MSNEQVTEVKDGSKELKFFLDNDLKNANPYSQEEQAALCQKIISDGCVIDPIVIWESNSTLVWGYEELSIAEEHGLAYEVRYVDFSSKSDCLAWIAEKRISQPFLNLFQKIELARSFVSYWIAKDEKKHEKDSPLRKAALARFGRDDKLAIAALKAGTSHNTVNKVNHILDYANSDIIKQCRNGELSISKASDLIKESGGEIPQDELTEAEVIAAEGKKTEAKAKRKAKEILALVKYSVEGFYTNEKLDEHGRKFFCLRWNEEHPESQIDMQEVQKEIENYSK